MSKSQDDFSDDFEDSEEEDFKPKPKSNSRPVRKTQHKSPPQKVINLGQAGGVTRKKSTKRPVSAGTVKKPKRPAVEYWNESLRQTGVGLSTESRSPGLSGLSKKQTKDMAFSSTSHYLRQLVGAEKPKRTMAEPQMRNSPGRPAYKSPEEYYDEILDLKKQIGVYQNDNSTMKSKVRRLEEDNLKKEREIEQLLDPSKSDELRRTLADRKPDAGAVIHSLKQKILKLEHQLKDREAAYARLQSDLKTTKIDEMKLQVDTFYKEIVRLNQLKSTDTVSSRRQKELESSAPRGENNVKMKALQETILRMNEKNLRLTTENKTLKLDLEKVLEDSAKAKDNQRAEYDDMSKKQLLGAISKLEKKLDKADADSMSLLSEMDNRHSDVQGKVSLEGSVAQRLDQLDQRETELLEELDKQRSMIKRLKDDRVHYRKKAEDKDKEMKSLKKEMEELQKELDSLYDRDRAHVTPRAQSAQSAVARRRSPSVSGSTPRKTGKASPRSRSRSPSISSDAGSRREERERNRRIEQFRQDTAAKHIQRNWRSHRDRGRDRERDRAEQDEAERRRRTKEHKAQVEHFRQGHAARQIQREWRGHRARKAKREEEDRRWRLERDKKVEQFTQQRAARRIQGGWIGHQARQRETDLDDAAEFLQSALRGHMSRREQLRTYKNRPPSRGASTYGEDEDESASISESVTESELDSAAEMIQSNIRGHMSRKEQLRRSRLEDTDSDLDEAVSTLQSAFRGHLARKGYLSDQVQRPLSPDSDYDDAVLTVQSAFKSHLARKDYINNYRRNSKSPASSRRGSTSHGRHKLDSAGEEEDEEDDKYSSFSRKSRRPSTRDVRSVAKKPPQSPRKASRAVAGDSDDDSDDDDLIVTSSRARVF